MGAGTVVTVGLANSLGAGQTPGGLPQPPLPLHHPHHHPPPPVAPNNVLNFIIGPAEYNTDNQTLHSIPFLFEIKESEGLKL